ncbi:MAG: flagellin [Rhodospirillaceae bacterium]
MPEGNDTMGDITLAASTRNSLLSVKDTMGKMTTTQRRLESGKAVDTAIDDAVKYFKAKGLTDRAQDFTDLKSNIDQTISLIGTASEGLSTVLSIYKQMKGLLQAAKVANGGTVIPRIATQWDNLLKQADSVASDSSYQGKSLVLPSDPSGWHDTGILDVAVSPSPNAAPLQIKTSILPPYSVGPEFSPAYNVAMTPVGAPVHINQTILNSGIPNSTMFMDGAGNGVGNYVIFSGYEPAIWRDNKTGEFIANDGSGVKDCILQNVSIVDQKFQQGANPQDITGAMIIQATISGQQNIPNGTYNFCLYDEPGGNQYYGNGFQGHPATAPPTISTPADTITQQTRPTINYSSAFGGFGTPDMITQAETACDNSIEFIHSLQAGYGGNSTFLQSRINFSNDMSNTLQEGSDKLTLADLNEESANLVACQTRQQIGIQSVAISGQQQQSILSLLR